VIHKNLSIGKTRLQGYIDALNKYNLPYQDELVVDCDNDYKKNQKILSKVFTKLKPDGVFASVERLAISSYYVCQSLGISIPQDVKIISFSSLEIAPLLNPSLSTITQPAFEMGAQAAHLLFKAIEDGPEEVVNQQIILKSRLYKRESTGHKV
jgi:LacI family transcriptional regulator